MEMKFLQPSKVDRETGFIEQNRILYYLLINNVTISTHLGGNHTPPLFGEFFSPADSCCEIKDYNMSVHVSGDVGTWVEENLDTNTEETSASFDNRNHDEKSWQPCFISTL